MSSDTDATGTHPLDRPVRAMLQVAMAVFAYTIAIGILNGLDLMEFSRTQLLSHLHGGTLGWMTLALLAASVWLFAVEGSRTAAQAARPDAGTSGEAGAAGAAGAADSSPGTVRGLASLACVAIPLYVLAFATTTGFLRPVAGMLTLATLAGFAVWAFSRARHVVLTVPRLLVLLGLAGSLIGGLFGVTNGLAIALDWRWLPETFFAAHAVTMEVGFVIPAALGFAEWGLRRGQPDEPATRSGRLQVGLFAFAFVWMLGLILADQSELAGTGVLFAIIGVVVFYVRTWRVLRSTPLTVRGHARHALAGGVLIGVTLVYVFVAIQAAGGDFEQMARGQVLSFIHLMAVGGTTNALLAFVLYLSGRVVTSGPVDDLVFWGVNVGLVGFVVGLTAEVTGLVMAFVPVMGLALLLAIAVHLVALGRDPGAAIPPVGERGSPVGT